jgi:hypothetical protein
VARWDAQVQQAPGNASAAPASAIYLQAGAWPAAGGALADARFGLALAAAGWGVRIPPQAAGPPGAFQPCVPVGQAREAIAIWLAILATRPPAGQLQAGLGALATGRGFQGVRVGDTMVATWSYPDSGYVTPPGGGPQATAVGYLLAREMTSLPASRVARVLGAAWPAWLNWHTTDARLAAALGLPLPQVPVPALPPVTSPAAALPQAPVCTA